MTRADPLAALGLSLRGGASELYLIRHGDAVPPADRPVSFDAYELEPLSERGAVQAAAVAARCAALGIAAAYASPIRRAYQTGEAIAAAAGVTVTAQADLREIAIGGTDDASMTLGERLDWLARVAIRDGSWSAIPGTEASQAVRARMLHALDAIAASHAGARVAVVSHAGSINAALGAIAGTPHDFLFPLANTSMSVVRIGGGRRLLMSANDASHLRALAAHETS